VPLAAARLYASLPVPPARASRPNNRAACPWHTRFITTRAAGQPLLLLATTFQVVEMPLNTHIQPASAGFPGCCNKCAWVEAPCPAGEAD